MSCMHVYEPLASPHISTAPRREYVTTIFRTHVDCFYERCVTSTHILRWMVLRRTSWNKKKNRWSLHSPSLMLIKFGQAIKRRANVGHSLKASSSRHEYNVILITRATSWCNVTFGILSHVPQKHVCRLTTDFLYVKYWILTSYICSSSRVFTSFLLALTCDAAIPRL